MSDSGRHYPDDETRHPHRRTELEVRAARKSGAGCCNDYANNMGCACLADALNYEAGLRQTTTSKPEAKEQSPLAQAIRELEAQRKRVFQMLLVHRSGAVVVDGFVWIAHATDVTKGNDILDSSRF